MNIYIYGNKTFKDEISKVLSKRTIKEKLNEIALCDELYGKTIEIHTVKKLESVIELNPNSIFLIDNKKVIQDNMFTKFFKFLTPKNGIKQNILDKYEIAIKVELDDVASITQYILDRLETYNINEITHIDDIRGDDTVSVLSDIR
jgi:hypothetical protein